MESFLQACTKALLATALLLNVAGCVMTGSNEPGVLEPLYPESALPEQWRLQGKLATSGLGAANFSWQQNADDLTIAIHAPLGAGAAKVKLQEGKLSVVTSEGDYADQEARAWLAANGLAVPLEALALWIQGLPYRHLPTQSVATKPNYVKAFKQAGWVVTVKRQRQQQCLNLPDRMEIQQGELRLKFGGMRWEWQQVATSGPKLFSLPSLALDCSNE